MHRWIFVSLFALLFTRLIVPLAAAELAIGAKAPEFKKLVGVDGKEHSLADLKDARLVIVCFACNDCPVVSDYQDRFIEFAKKYESKGVVFVAVNSNIAGGETEDLAHMKTRAKEKGYNFLYLLDKTGKLADEYGAKATPHLFVLDAKRTLQYAGAFDDKADKARATKQYLVDAVDALLAGKTPAVPRTKAFGCGIYNKPE